MHFLRTNFSGGEASPLLVGRADLPVYGASCVTLENMIVRPYGGAFKAPGTLYVGEVKSSASRHRLVAFRVSESENYMLELGNQSMRFWRNGASGPEYLQVNSNYNVLIGAFNPTASYVLGSLAENGGNYYLRTKNPKPVVDGSFIAANWTQITPPGPLTWPTPWTTADLPSLQWCQIGRVIVFVHPDYTPYVLELPNDLDSTPTWNTTLECLEWSETTDTTAVNWRFSPIIYTFPPLTESPGVGEGRTLTLSINETAWANGVNYVTGNIRKEANVAYYCTANHLSATATNKPGSGSAWTTVWRTAKEHEYSRLLTASSAEALRDVAVGDDLVIEPPVTGRSSTLQLSSSSSLGPSASVFIQGAFIVKGEWATGAAPIGTVTLEESRDNFRWEAVREWTTDTVNAGTISLDTEAPTEGAWYRLKATISSGGAASKSVRIEPAVALMKLALRVKAINSTTVVQVDSLLPYGGTLPPDAFAKAATSFYLNAFSADNGFPSAVGFHNLRLWFGGTEKEPNRVRASAVNDFLNFATGSEDDDAIDITLASNEASQVNWIASFRQGVVVGTSSEEWTVQGGDGTEVIKPSNIQAIRRNRAGSKNLGPIQTKDALLWVSRTGRHLYEMGYVFTEDNYQAADMTERAEHITAGGIEEVALQSEPDPILWCVTGEGILAGFSYNRQNEITAWFRRTTDGEFESVATMAGTTSDADEVWVIVKRTINGSTKRYIERFAPVAAAYDFSDLSGLCYVDCAKPHAGGISSSGFSYLEGEAVKVYSYGENGVASLDSVVSGGSVDYSGGAGGDGGFIGLAIPSVIQAMPLDVPLRDGSSASREWIVKRARLLLNNSQGGSQHGKPSDPGFIITYPSSALFTGRIDEHINANWEMTTEFTIKHSDPTPFNLLGYVLIAEVDGQ
jgi:hypothetical protein